MEQWLTIRSSIAHQMIKVSLMWWW